MNHVANRAIRCALVAALLAALPVAGRAGAGDFSSADPLDGFFGTVWHCTTYGGTRLTHVFNRAKDDATIAVATRFWIPNRGVFPSEEYYRYSERTDQWTARLASGTLIVRGPAWNSGRSWRLSGAAPEGRAVTPVRMTFTVLRGNGFRRDFTRENGQTWTTYAGETCRRAPHG
jgi:hypothetical protein